MDRVLWIREKRRVEEVFLDGNHRNFWAMDIDVDVDFASKSDSCHGTQETPRKRRPIR